MAFNITAQNSCKIVTVKAKSYVGTGGTTGDIKITDLDTGVTTTHPIAFASSGIVSVVNIASTDLPAENGAFRVCLWESGVEQVCKPLLLHCDIDCCLVKLTNEIIDCACDCVRCSSALAKAQKIFLLLHSANSSVALASTAQGSTNAGYYQDIVNKYLKAKEICDNSCGCNC